MGGGVSAGLFCFGAGLGWAGFGESRLEGVWNWVRVVVLRLRAGWVGCWSMFCHSGGIWGRGLFGFVLLRWLVGAKGLGSLMPRSM